MVLSVFGAILEIAGISVLLHTILSILKTDFIQHNILTSLVYEKLQIENNQQFILVMSIILLIVYILKNITLVYINKKQVRIAFEMSDYMSEKHFEDVSKKSLLYFVSKKSAEIINELYSTSVTLAEAVIIPSILLGSELAVIALLLVAVLVYQPILFLFTVSLMLPGAYLLIRYNRKKLMERGAEINSIIPKVHENINELTYGIANVKLWDGEAYFFKRYTKYKKRSNAIKETIYISANYIPLRMYEVIAIAGILTVVIFGVITQQYQEAVASYITIYAGISFRLLPSINRVIASSNNISTFSYILRFFNTGNQYSEDVPQGEKIAFEQLELRNAHFSYPNGKIIFDHLNFKISKGEFIGILGESGSGKSTLVQLVTSLIPPTQGELWVNGAPLKAAQTGAFRYLFSYVKQDVFMLNSSIRKNVAFLEENPDEQKIEKCLKQVNLWDWVQQLDKNWDTNVGELGNQISGGQRQRIAIARALYKEAEIFVFDEVTNNLDTYSKEQTLQAINLLKKAGKTAVFITHKPEELSICDNVYEVKDKKIEAY